MPPTSAAGAWAAVVKAAAQSTQSQPTPAPATPPPTPVATANPVNSWASVVGSAGRAMATANSPTSAFSRPIPVIVMGPKPLPVKFDGAIPKPPAPPKPAADDESPSLFQRLGAALRTAGDAATKAASLMRQPMQVLLSGISAVQTTVAAFVAKANPGVILRWNLAVDDLYASIGRALVPVLEKAIVIVRSVADAFFSLTPKGSKLLQALAAATIGLVVFAAAVAAVESAATMGISTIIAGIAGALSGLFVVLTDNSTIKNILDSLGQAFNEVGDALGGAMDAMAPAMQQVAGVVANIASQFAKFATMGASVLGKIAPAIAEIAVVVLKLVSALAPVFAVVATIVELPVIALGAALVVLGTVLQTLSPLIDGVMEAFSTLTAPLMDVGHLLLDTFMTVLNELGKALSGGDLKSSLQQVASYLVAFAQAVASVARQVISWVRALFGIAESGGEAGPKPLKDSTGAAVRSVQIGGVEDVLKRAQVAAYSLGSGAQKPEDKTAANTSTIAAEVAQIKAKFDSLVTTAGAIVTAVEKTATAIITLPADIAKAVIDAPKKIAQAVGGSGTPSVLGTTGRVLGGPVGEIAGEAADRLRRNLPTWLQP